jgi:uncharacterized membrane protein
MTPTTLPPSAAEYVQRLRSAAHDLPRARRDELAAEIEAHLVEVIPPDATEAQILTELDRLGDPQDIVAAERPSTPTESTASADVPRRGAQEWVAIVLLLVGGFAWGVGWFIGALMLWTSRAWTLRDKLIGTLIIPGGLALTWLVLAAPLLISPSKCGTVDGRETCTGGTSVSHTLFLLLLIASLIAPFVTATYLAVRAGRAARVARAA